MTLAREMPSVPGEVLTIDSNVVISSRRMICVARMPMVGLAGYVFCLKMTSRYAVSEWMGRWDGASQRCHQIANSMRLRVTQILVVITL